jgi:ADP-heptose:LPS heptosyltransferase
MNRAANVILVAHCEGVGDSVLSIPFLSLVSQAFQLHDLYLLTGRGRRDLFLGLKRVHVIQSHEVEEIETVLSWPLDIVFDLGTGTEHVTDWLAVPELAYRVYVGFCKPKKIRDEVAVPRLPRIPRWKQFILLLSSLGIPVDGQPECPFAISQQSKSYAEMLLSGPPSLPLIAIAPGASCDERKRWPVEHFAAVVRELHSRSPAAFALIGSREDMPLGNAIADRLDFEIDNLMGLTTLGSVAHILSSSQLLVANDNGIMHLGGLLSTPTLGLFGPSDPMTWHPMGSRSMILKAPSDDISDISPSSVVRACTDLLGWQGGQSLRS